MQSSHPSIFIPIDTGDGSRTLYDPARDVYFRSMQGARTESEYVFLSGSGLANQPAPRQVLELGLGTGLNFLVTAASLRQHYPEQLLDYHVVEAEPLGLAAFDSLQHEVWLKDSELLGLLRQVLQASSQQPGQLINQQQGTTRLSLYPQRWQDCVLPAGLQVQAIYHDPFGPEDNPDCWTADCFAWERQVLGPQGRLVTYAASTAMRRALVKAGFVIASLPGSGRKREMTVAGLNEAALEGCEILRKARFFNDV